MPYHSSALEARNRLVIALEEAKETLPAAVLRLHWMAARDPAPWRAVEAAYLGQPARDPDVLNALTDLALMDEALSCLKTMLAEEGTTGSRKLAKMKRVEL